MEKNQTKEFGRWCKKRRKELSLTQVELAELIGTRQGRVSAYELGKFSPSIEMVAHICRVLGPYVVNGGKNTPQAS